MPELPETETIARDLDAAISGRKIRKVSVSKRDVLREASARTLSKRLQDATILRSWRRAKLVIIDLDNGDRLVVQPRFTGGLLIDDGNFRGSELKYSTLRLDLDDGRALHYADVRRLDDFEIVNFVALLAGAGVETVARLLIPQQPARSSATVPYRRRHRRRPRDPSRSSRSRSRL